MYIRKIHLNQIRGFKDLTLDLTNDNGGPRLWTVIIGANGTGKTSLLRAIAIGLSPDSDANAMLASPVGTFVTAGKRYGGIDLTLSGSNDTFQNRTVGTTIKAVRNRESVRRGRIRFNVDEHSDEITEQQEVPESFLLGYGISRVRSGKGEFREFRVFDSTRTLFDYDAELAPTELTLRRIRDHLGSKIYDRIMAGIKRALNLSHSTAITIESGGGVVVRGDGIEREIPIEGWADGYRFNLAWIIDVYGWALQASALTKTGGIRGILLLDELEQHTHPSIQMGFVPRLKELWPDLQVIGTTHSPLVLLGAEADEVIVLKREEEGITVAPEAVSFAGYSAEDVLVDERLFDAPAQRPEASELLLSYQHLVAIPANQRTAENRRRIREIAQSLSPGAAPGIGESPLLQELKALRQKYNL